MYGIYEEKWLYWRSRAKAIEELIEAEQQENQRKVKGNQVNEQVENHTKR